LDGAHNPAAAAVLVETWREEFGEERAVLIFGSMQDKETGAVLEALAPIVGEVVVVAVGNPRANPVERLSGLVREHLPGVSCREADGLRGALAIPVKGRRLVTGSLFLVGEALASVRGGVAERTVQ
jgi:dihydrofolate synthase / folylpolyglutamate synthase